MNAFHIDPHQEFLVLGGTVHSVAATLTIDPGETAPRHLSPHQGSDSWLFVLSGTGLAAIQGRRVRLTAGALLRIAASEIPEIRNTGRQPLVIRNLFTPPVY